jgi:GPH family glycoside/pentoside/hexuronide:cation symporter
MLGAVGFGLAESLGNYLNLFFWGFKAQELAIFILVIAMASFVVLGAAPGLAGRFGKGPVAMTAALVAGAITPAMVVFKLAGWLPPAGSSALLGVLCISVFVSYSSLIIGTVMVGAMIADITDEHELRTGARQEGLLFAAMMLISKAASGLAPLVAGIVIKLSGFPDDAKPGTVDPSVIVSLGVFAAVFALVIGVLTTIAYARYGLTRQGHAKIVAELNERRGVALQAHAVAAE